MIWNFLLQLTSWWNWETELSALLIPVRNYKCAQTCLGLSITCLMSPREPAPLCVGSVHICVFNPTNFNKIALLSASITQLSIHVIFSYSPMNGITEYWNRYNVHLFSSDLFFTCKLLLLSYFILEVLCSCLANNGPHELEWERTEWWASRRLFAISFFLCHIMQIPFLPLFYGDLVN